MLTVNSVVGNTNHIPNIPAIYDSKNARGIIIINPLKREIAFAGFGFSVDVK